MNTEQDRADFEAWCKERFGQIPLWIEEDSKYLLSSVQLRFEAYQAVLASPEVQALRKDAERYRWLRDPCSGAECVIFYSRGDYGKGLMSGPMIDAAIDAAMEKQKWMNNKKHSGRQSTDWTQRHTLC